MVQTINNFERIGIEAELRTYYFAGNPGSNKTVLAQTNSTVSELGIPYLTIVVEGNKSAKPYMELVFGPVVGNELNIVKKGIDVALKATGTKLSEWIAHFNSNLPNNARRKLTLLLGANDYKLVNGISKCVSIQANILTPLRNLSSAKDLKNYFNGLSNLTECENNFINKVLSSFNSKKITDINGALFLTAYICYIYGKLNTLITRNIASKQELYILPKVNLKDLLSVLLVDTDSINSFCAQLRNILSKFRDERRFDKISKNIETIIDMLTNDRSYIICPNLLNLTKDIFVNSGKKHIVLEFRKTTKLVLLRQIDNYLTNNGISFVPKIW